MHQLCITVVKSSPSWLLLCQMPFKGATKRTSLATVKTKAFYLFQAFGDGFSRCGAWCYASAWPMCVGPCKQWCGCLRTQVARFDDELDVWIVNDELASRFSLPGLSPELEAKFKQEKLAKGQ